MTISFTCTVAIRSVDNAITVAHIYLFQVNLNKGHDVSSATVKCRWKELGLLSSGPNISKSRRKCFAISLFVVIWPL